MTGDVYKILPRDIWQAFSTEGELRLHGVDARDGFVHLSAADQLQETLQLHFAGHDNLVVAAFAVDGLGEGLRWEASRNGVAFPHYYGVLGMVQVTAHFDISHGPAGHVLPDALTQRIA